MPSAPYPVSGTFKDSSGTAIRGAVVQALNTRTAEYLPSAAASVTNASGEYTIDLANLPNGYQNGDAYRLFAYKPQQFTSAEHVVDTSVGSQSSNFTADSVAYTTPGEVAGFIGLKNAFHITSRPNIVDVCKRIREAEDYIEFRTGHAWRSVTVSNEYHSSNEGVYTTGSGRAIYLFRRAVKTFASASGDKLEVWTGSSYEQWQTTKTEGRGNDFWFDYEQGILYMSIGSSVYNTPKDIRVTYRFGESVVAQDIARAARILAASYLLEGEDRSVLLPSGEIGGVPYGERIRKWSDEVENILLSRSEIRVAPSLNLQTGNF